MKRYGTVVEGGRLYVETDEDPIEIGAVDEIVERTGGGTYEVHYDEDHARTVEWLDLDEDDAISIDVMETVTGMDYPKPFVKRLNQRSHDAGEDWSERTEYFVDIMTTVWENKGNLDHLEENPFR